MPYHPLLLWLAAVIKNAEHAELLTACMLGVVLVLSAIAQT